MENFCDRNPRVKLPRLRGSLSTKRFQHLFQRWTLPIDGLWTLSAIAEEGIRADTTRTGITLGCRFGSSFYG
jgi:hypothetical protein